MNTEYKHIDHFRTIALQYNQLRMTNPEPVANITRQLSSLSSLVAADIGCGTGRYTSLLLQHLQDKSPLIHCIDYSLEMLEQLGLHFAEQGCQATSAIQANSLKLPLRKESLNCIFTFNAIHHFGLSEFLCETARVLQPNGYLFIYTRLRSQNNRNIWGRYFPSFTAKETRLYELGELEDEIAHTDGLELTGTQNFQFERESSLEELLYRAQHHHYSTFELYTPDEFNAALQIFADGLQRSFKKLDKIEWEDENILLTVRKRVRPLKYNGRHP